MARLFTEMLEQAGRILARRAELCVKAGMTDAMVEVDKRFKTS